MKYTYNYPRPAVTTDAIIFGYDPKSNELNVLLIKRANEPFKDKWALPGGFLDMDETTEQCVHRELKEETGLTDVILEEMQVFSEIDRDPRGRTISIVYFGLVSTLDHEPKAGDDASNAKWFSILRNPPMSFDHHKIIAAAVNKLYDKIKYHTIDYLFLPKGFSLIHLKQIETILSDYQIKNHITF